MGKSLPGVRVEKMRNGGNMKLLITLLILLITSFASAETSAPTPTPGPALAPSDSSGMVELKPVDTIIFTDTTPREIGRITWADGEFKFTGKANKAARQFFDVHLKNLIDSYLIQSGCPRR